MNKLNIFLSFLIFIFANTAFSQDLTGTWRGSGATFGMTAEYIVEIKQDGNKITGTTTQKTVSALGTLKKVNATIEFEGTFDGKRFKIKSTRVIHLESESGNTCLSKGKFKYNNKKGVETISGTSAFTGKYYMNGKYTFNPACLGHKFHSSVTKDKVEDNPTAIKVEDITEKLPEEYKEREFVTTAEITVSKPALSISFWDKNKEDGDQISVYLNDKSILEKHTVTKKHENVLCQLKKGDNYIIINADNLGKVEPNTANVSLVSEGKNLMDIDCRSNLDKSVVIKIIYE